MPCSKKSKANKGKPTKATFGTKILGTQLFRATQMCQGSTCHVVAQHGDISKLNKALLLTWEVCATIAIKTSKEISHRHVPKKTRQTKANKQRQHLWHKDSWDTTVWVPRCAHVRVPRYMSKRTAAREPRLRSRVRVNCACLLAQHVLSTGWTKQLYWLGKLCKFSNLTYDICVAMLEMKCETALPRLVEQSFLGHLCLKHTDVSALNVSHILAERGNFSRLSEALLHWDVVCRYSPRKTYPADKFSNKFGHLTQQNLFVAQRFLGHDCLGLHRCVRGQRVMLLHSMEMLFLLTWEVCATIAIKTSKEISQCYVPKKTRPTKATFVAQRFLGHNCWGLHRCVRGQRVMLLHSMEISASLTKLFCWLGKSVQPLPSRHPKRFHNAMFQKRQGKHRQTDKGNIWHRDSWDTTV